MRQLRTIRKGQDFFSSSQPWGHWQLPWARNAPSNTALSNMLPAPVSSNLDDERKVSTVPSIARSLVCLAVPAQIAVIGLATAMTQHRRVAKGLSSVHWPHKTVGIHAKLMLPLNPC
jgi:hypothetical protein